MADEPSKNTRTYKVLRNYASDEGWEPITEIEASSPEQAIRLTAVEQGEGRYVAVPERNWSEIGVRVITRAPIIEFIDDTESAAPVAAGDPDVLGGASGVGNEPGAGAADTPADPIVAEAEALTDEGVLVEDADYQERKAEIAARRT